jgi:hypothetical protein
LASANIGERGGVDVKVDEVCLRERLGMELGRVVNAYLGHTVARDAVEHEIC